MFDMEVIVRLHLIKILRLDHLHMSQSTGAPRRRIWVPARGAASAPKRGRARRAYDLVARRGTLCTGSSRQGELAAAGYNLSNCGAEEVLIDLLTRLDALTEPMCIGHGCLLRRPRPRPRIGRM
jgi:hypothetical protein